MLTVVKSGATVCQGATIRRDEETGEIFIARVIHGGLADRSGETQLQESVSHHTDMKCGLIMCVCVRAPPSWGPVSGGEWKPCGGSGAGADHPDPGGSPEGNSINPPRQVESCSNVCFSSCQINSQGTILFKVIPDAAQSSSSLKSVRNVFYSSLSHKHPLHHTLLQ